MSELTKLIDAELQDQDFSRVEVQTLYNATKRNEKYTRLATGLFVPDIGIMGKWREKDKKVVKDIIRSYTLRDDPGRIISGYEDPNKPAYSVLEKMKPGDIARVRVGKKEFNLAAFSAQMPATALVLFVK